MKENAFNREKVSTILNGRGLTITEAAEKCGTSRSVLSQWLSGRRNPKRQAIRKIAAALRVNISEISIYHDDDLVTPPPVADPLPEPDINAHSTIFTYVLSELKRQVALSGQVKVADIIGISPSQVSLLVNGKAQISDLKLSAFLRLLPKMKITFNSETGVESVDVKTQLHALIDRMTSEDAATTMSVILAMLPKYKK